MPMPKSATKHCMNVFIFKDIKKRRTHSLLGCILFSAPALLHRIGWMAGALRQKTAAVSRLEPCLLAQPHTPPTGDG
jgi:hypothetical protein